MKLSATGSIRRNNDCRKAHELYGFNAVVLNKKNKQLSPQVKILVLTIHEEEDYIQKGAQMAIY